MSFTYTTYTEAETAKRNRRYYFRITFTLPSSWDTYYSESGKDYCFDYITPEKVYLLPACANGLFMANNVPVVDATDLMKSELYKPMLDRAVFWIESNPILAQRCEKDIENDYREVV